MSRRSKLRAILGRVYHALKRQIDWRLSGKRFARRKAGAAEFPEVICHHETPLLRNLPDLEMWLQHNKVANLRLAVPMLDGLVLQSGETFSFWRLLGKPTRAKGYRAGMILERGRVKPGVGGGLCQLSNLLYWLTLHTPLTVTERWRHSYDVFPDVERRLPFGSGATCAYPALDLQIRNGTTEPFLLCLNLTETHLAGEWRARHPAAYRYEVYQDFHQITHEPGIGYLRRNSLRRRILRQDGVQVADEPVAENHALMMYQPFLPGGGNQGG